MSNLEAVIDYGLRFIGTPYLWGGSSPDCGFDCSGLASEILMAGGFLKERSSAQGIHDLFKDEHVGAAARGALLFFGESAEKIVHVAIGLSDKLMLEAAGGCHTTTTVVIADKNGAFVKVRPVSSRRDLMAIAMPRYE